MKTTDLPFYSKRLVMILRTHYVGESISGENLVEKLNLPGLRELREVVEYTREIPEPVLSTFDGHYSWPTGWEDDAYEHCVAQQKKMGSRFFRNAENVEKGMEKHFGEPRLPMDVGA